MQYPPFNICLIESMLDTDLNDKKTNSKSLFIHCACKAGPGAILWRGVKGRKSPGEGGGGGTSS